MDTDNLKLEVRLRGSTLWIWPRAEQNLAVTIEITKEQADHIRDMVNDKNAYAKSLVGVMRAERNP